METTCLERAAKLAKAQDTRHLALEGNAVLPQLTALVHMASTTTKSPANKDHNDNASPFPVSNNDAAELHVHDSGASVAFDEPVEASSEASAILTRAFLILRNACAGCPANQNRVRSAGLSQAALDFAADQAHFACGGVAAPGGIASASSPLREGIADVATAAETPKSTAESAGSVRLAVRAALQFACNSCVGNEASQALLWDQCFPRRLMELVNSLKTDRTLLSLAVALIYNCCLSSVDKNGVGSLAEPRGNDRLSQVAGDRAFCCLLMKVVPFDLTPRAPGSTAPTSPSSSTNISGKSDNSDGLDRDDPAAEWLYLLFCRFIQEYLSSDLYDAVGIRAGGRPAAAASRRSRPPGTENGEGNEECSGGGMNGVGGDAAVGGVGGSLPSNRSGDAGFDGAMATAGVEKGMAGGVGSFGASEEDFFFPVTPEQLIMLNLTEVAAADATVTGGEILTRDQRRACNALCSWLIDLLAAMPLEQSLLPHTRDHKPASMPTPTPLRPPKHHTVASTTAEEKSNDKAHGTPGGDLETETTRRRMREEARSAVLRALGTLLAGCDDDTRQVAANYRATEPGCAASPEDRQNTRVCMAAGAPARAVPTLDTAAARGPGFGPGGEREQRGLVDLCVRLLSGCGGAAEPKARVVDHVGRSGMEEYESGVDVDGGATGRLGVPVGRKAQLLKVIGNACFRCRISQERVRELGALPLVLNHCAVDGGNPLLREYALLAVRNLCEGNEENQASIAALQPQGCSPEMDQVLADMGLEGRVDGRGKVRLESLRC